MKKVLALSLALVLALSLTAVTAFAETITAVGDKDIPVNAQYINGTTNPTVYSADVTWGAMSFTYTRTGENSWNADTHTYDESTTGTWLATGNTITVVNHSNAKLDVDFAYASVAGLTTVTGAFSSDSVTLNEGAVGGYATADSVTSTLTLSGALPSTYSTAQKVGTVTVTLSTPTV